MASHSEDLDLGNDDFWITAFSWFLGDPQPVVGHWSVTGADTWSPSNPSVGGVGGEADLQMASLGQATTFALAPVVAVPSGLLTCRATVSADPKAGVTLTLVGSDGVSEYDIVSASGGSGIALRTARVALPSGTTTLGMRIDIVEPFSGGYYLQLFNPALEVIITDPEGGWGVGQIRMGAA